MRIYIALLSLAIGFFILGCNSKKESISPEVKNISESVYASGIVLSKNQYEVFTKVNGIVDGIVIKEGDLVKKGDLLFSIENPNARLSRGNAQLNAAANDYQVNFGKLKDARNSIDLAQKNLLNDSLMLVRQKTLWNQNIGAKVELEQKELLYEKSKVALNQAKLVYNDLKRQLNLASDLSKNNLKIAQSAENDLMIRSSVDGVVYKINIEEGELATANSPMAVIGEEVFIIELYVDEFDIVKIKKDQKVFVRMDSYKNQVFEAAISNIYPMMNERTRTFKVEAMFTNKPAVLYPNLTLEASIMINQKPNALTIPTGYLITDSTVMLEDGSIQKVRVGLKDYNLTEILTGIDAKSKIIMPEK